MGEETSWPTGPSCEDRSLLRELTQRVTGEFASAISVISIAAARSSSEDAKTILNGASDLLEDYAHLHNVLRAPKYATSVDAGAYVRRLCHVISRSKLEVMGVELTLAECPLHMSSADCWRLGMILSELITNAARHAFSKRGGVVRVELSRLGAMVRCRVVDNGTADTDVCPGRGLKSIEALAKRLNGEMEQSCSAQGSITTIAFPADIFLADIFPSDLD